MWMVAQSAVANTPQGKALWREAPPSLLLSVAVLTASLVEDHSINFFLLLSYVTELYWMWILKYFYPADQPSSSDQTMRKQQQQQPVTSVSKLTPSPPSHSSSPCLHPKARQLCLARLSGDERGACLFSSPSSSQASGEKWICMGVTNPGSFLSSIPSLCDKAAVYAGETPREDVFNGTTSVEGPSGRCSLWLSTASRPLVPPMSDIYVCKECDIFQEQPDGESNISGNSCDTKKLERSISVTINTESHSRTDIWRV
ncbi:hypothetical protein PAMA_020592 [Pampus argenteus]